MNKWILGVCTAAVLYLPVAGCGQAGNTAKTGNAANTSNTAAEVRLPRTMNGTTPNALTVDRARDMHAETRLANRIVQAGLANQASVLVVGDTAYIGVLQKAGAHGDLANAEKDKISAVAKQFNPQIKTVYVSANPDVYTHFQSYAADLQRGQPVSGIWNNFRSIVTRVWPNAR